MGGHQSIPIGLSVEQLDHDTGRPRSVVATGAPHQCFPRAEVLSPSPRGKRVVVGVRHGDRPFRLTLLRGPRRLSLRVSASRPRPGRRTLGHVQRREGGSAPPRAAVLASARRNRRTATPGPGRPTPAGRGSPEQLAGAVPAESGIPEVGERLPAPGPRPGWKPPAPRVGRDPGARPARPTVIGAARRLPRYAVCRDRVGA